VIADVGISATGQYLRPMLERASVKPKVVETKPKKPSRSRRVTVDEDEPHLIAAK
jgi:excinuclease ABC subunit A